MSQLMFAKPDLPGGLVETEYEAPVRPVRIAAKAPNFRPATLKAEPSPGSDTVVSAVVTQNGTKERSVRLFPDAMVIQETNENLADEVINDVRIDAARVKSCLIRIREARNALSEFESLILSGNRCLANGAENHVPLIQLELGFASRPSASTTADVINGTGEASPKVISSKYMGSEQALNGLNGTEVNEDHYEEPRTPLSPNNRGKTVNAWEQFDSICSLARPDGAVDQVALALQSAQTTRKTAREHAAFTELDHGADDDEHGKVEMLFWSKVAGTYGWLKIPIWHPQAKPRLIWLLLGLFMLLHQSISIPVYIGFNCEATGVWAVLDNIVTVYFMCDMIMSCITGIETELGDVITEPWVIIKTYTGTWALMDAVSTIPWQWIDLDSGGDEVRLMRFLRLLRIARLMRILKLRSLFSSVAEVSEGSKIFQLLQGSLSVFMPILLAVHWLSCGWCMFGKMPDPNPGWIPIAETMFVSGQQLDDASIYAVAFYYVLVTMTTVGYGDIHPYNQTELAFAIGMLPVASILFATMMGNLGDMIQNMNRKSRILGDHKILLNQYLSFRKCQPRLRKRIRKCMLDIWDNSDDFTVYEKELALQLPQVVREELCYHFHGHLLSTVPILSWMHGHKVCLRRLASLLLTRTLDFGDYLFRAGSQNDTLYFLTRGQLWLSLNDPLKVDIEHDDTVPQTMVGFLVNRMKQRIAQDNQSVLQNSSSVIAESRWNKTPGGGSIGSCRLIEDVMADMRQHDRTLLGLVLYLQKKWRKKKAAEQAESEKLCGAKFRGTIMEKKSAKHMRSNSIMAPAYLGESCLWTPCHEWDEVAPPRHMYHARCEDKAELVYINRGNIKTLLEHFSPWLPERFEDFRKSVSQKILEMVEGKGNTEGAEEPPEPAKRNSDTRKAAWQIDED